MLPALAPANGLKSRGGGLPFRGQCPWAGLLALAMVLGACGFRNDPVPRSQLVPRTFGVQAHFREQVLLISWAVPDAELQRRYGPVQSYSIILRQLPLSCPVCPPVDTRTLDAPADSRGLSVEGGAVFLAVSSPLPAANWLVSVRTAYRSVQSGESEPVLAEGLGVLPQAILQAEHGAGARTVRLFWAARRERQVHVLTAGGAVEVRDFYFRANLFGRVPPAGWPIAPMNPAPLTTLQQILPLPAPGGGHERVEYAMRWVDQFGNEGPLSAPVPIALGK